MASSNAKGVVVHDSCKSSKPLLNQRMVCSWSGGKDSCLALYEAIEMGGIPRALVAMLIAEGGRTRNHGLATEVIEAQAASLDLPLVTVPTHWSDYETKLTGALAQLRETGIEVAVFGDIDIEAHRDWEERVSSVAGLRACLPLWQRPRLDVIDKFLTLGFEAYVVAAKAELLGPEYLGRKLDRALVAELGKLGIDECGENGEYHTVVTAGPLFRYPLKLVAGESLLLSGYWFLDFQLAT